MKTYFEQLCARVDAGRSYSKLMKLLYDTPFYAILPLDENRIQDAITMRDDWELYTLYLMNASDREVSVLEVLIAMALRVETNIMYDEEMGDRTSAWFWMMIENLEINQHDSEFNEDYVSFVLHRFMNREFDADGTGSIARINPSQGDARQIHFWQLFNMGLSNLIERGLK